MLTIKIGFNDGVCFHLRPSLVAIDGTLFSKSFCNISTIWFFQFVNELTVEIIIIIVYTFLVPCAS